MYSDFDNSNITPRLVRSRFCHCEPVSLTMAGVAVAGAGAGTSIAGQTQQNKAAKQVEQQKADATTRAIEENRKRATADYIMSVQDIQLRQDQEHQALDEKQSDINRQEKDATGTAKVSFAERGVSGQALADVLNDYRMQADQAAGRLLTNREFADYQHQRDIEARRVEYDNRVTSIQPYQKQPVKPVDYFGPIFGMADSVLKTPAMQNMAQENLKNWVNPLKF